MGSEYFETSSVEDFNVSETFDYLIDQIERFSSKSTLHQNEDNNCFSLVET